MEQTIGLLQNAAAMLELDAREWRDRKAPDHLGRGKDQMIRIAETNEGMAKVLRKHADELAPTALTGAQGS